MNSKLSSRIKRKSLSKMFAFLVNLPKLSHVNNRRILSTFFKEVILGYKPFKEIQVASHYDKCMAKLSNRLIALTCINSTSILIYDIAKQKIVKILVREEGKIKSIVKVNRSTLACSCNDNKVEIWDFLANLKLAEKSDHFYKYQSIGIAILRKNIVSYIDNFSIRIWNIKTNQVQKTLSVPNSYYDSKLTDNSALYSILKLNNDLLVSCNDSLIFLWNYNKGECVSVITNISPITSLMDIDTESFAVKSPQLIIYKVKNNALLKTDKEITYPPNSEIFSIKNTYHFVCVTKNKSYDALLSVINYENQKINEIKLPSQLGELIIFNSKSIILSLVSRGLIFVNIENNWRVNFDGVINRTEENVLGLLYLSENMIAVRTKLSVIVFNTVSRKQEKKLNEMCSDMFKFTNEILILACPIKGLFVWNYKSDTNILLNSKETLLVKIDLLRFASGSISDSYNIAIWSIHREDVFKVRRRLFGHDNTVCCLSKYAKGQLLSGGTDKNIKLWNIDEGYSIVSFKISITPITILTMQSSKLVILACEYSKIGVLNIMEDTSKMKEKFLTNSVISFVELDKNIVITLTKDNLIKVWKIKDKILRCLKTIEPKEKGSLLHSVAKVTPKTFVYSNGQNLFYDSL